MVDAREYFGVAFITLKDLAETPLQAVISRVEEGKYGKLNLIFEDGTAIGLNAGNTRAMVRAYGHNTDAWPGLTVELSAGEAEYQGKMQPSVVITPVSPAFTPTQKAAARRVGAGKHRDGRRYSVLKIFTPGRGRHCRADHAVTVQWRITP